MRPLQSASIGNKKEHRYFGWSSGRIRRRAWGPVGNRPPPPVHSMSAFWQVHHGARDPAAARRFAHPPTMQLCWPIVQQRPTGGGHGDSLARRPGTDWPLRFPGCAPPVDLPPAILRCFGRATVCYVDRSVGSPHRPGTLSGTGQRLFPPPFHAHTSDPTPITPVKGTYSGKIESLESQHAKLRMRSKPSTNQSWKFDNQLYVIKTSYRLGTGEQPYRFPA